MTLRKSLYCPPFVNGNKNISLICQDDYRPVMHDLEAPYLHD